MFKQTYIFKSIYVKILIFKIYIKIKERYTCRTTTLQINSKVHSLKSKDRLLKFLKKGGQKPQEIKVILNRSILKKKTNKTSPEEFRRRTQTY